MSELRIIQTNGARKARSTMARRTAYPPFVSITRARTRRREPARVFDVSGRACTMAQASQALRMYDTNRLMPRTMAKKMTRTDEA